MVPSSKADRLQRVKRVELLLCPRGERKAAWASAKRGDGEEPLLLGCVKEVKQRRLTDGWDRGAMQHQDADTVARQGDEWHHGNTCKMEEPPKIPHVVSDDGFSSWLMTYSEHHDRDGPMARKQVPSATKTWE